MAKLLVHESAGVRAFDIVDNEVHIGRELDNTLRLPDPSISRHHAVIRKMGGGYEIQDLQSSNGVLINGNRVQSSPIRNGDRITLGQIQLTFQDPQPEVASTVAIQVAAPPVPTGTVRMSADDLAAIHTGKAPEASPAPGQNQDQVATGPVLNTTAKQPVPPPTPFPPMPLAPPIPTPKAFGEFTNPGTIQASFLGPLLPSIPDDAIPTGERGDFVTRLLAALIDYSPVIFLQIVSMLLMPASLAVGGLSAGFGALAAVGCLSVILWLGYLFFVPYCWIKFGATPGKKIMKLRVVPESNPSGRIDLGMAVLRLLGYLVNGIIAWIITIPFAAIFVMGSLMTGGFHGNLILMKVISLVASILPYLLILFTVERKGLHDMISKTIVIKVDR
jgi:pSer/pThr/pTyr-binding forkhead associated (FHA) protein/uncharacterized RDD family membrane protein YckC